MFQPDTSATKPQPRLKPVLFNLYLSSSIGELMYGILKVHTEDFPEPLIGRVAATQINEFRRTAEFSDQIQYQLSFLYPAA